MYDAERNEIDKQAKRMLAYFDDEDMIGEPELLGKFYEFMKAKVGDNDKYLDLNIKFHSVKKTPLLSECAKMLSDSTEELKNAMGQLDSKLSQSPLSQTEDEENLAIIAKYHKHHENLLKSLQSINLLSAVEKSHQRLEVTLSDVLRLIALTQRLAKIIRNSEKGFTKAQNREFEPRRIVTDKRLIFHADQNKSQMNNAINVLIHATYIYETLDGTISSIPKHINKADSPDSKKEKSPSSKIQAKRH